MPSDRPIARRVRFPKSHILKGNCGGARSPPSSVNKRPSFQHFPVSSGSTRFALYGGLYLHPAYCKGSISCLVSSVNSAPLRLPPPALNEPDGENVLGNPPPPEAASAACCSLSPPQETAMQDRSRCWPAQAPRHLEASPSPTLPPTACARASEPVLDSEG